MPVAPNEADPPLLVNPNRVSPLPAAAQGFQFIPRRRRQNTHSRGGLQLQQLPQRHTLKCTEAPRMLVVKEFLVFLRSKTLNPPQTILRKPLYVNNTIVGCPGFIAPTYRLLAFLPKISPLTDLRFSVSLNGRYICR